MDGVNEFLEVLKQGQYTKGNFLGLLNVLIGRRIENPKGMVISTGLSWRTLSQRLKKVRWEREVVRELGLDLKGLPSRHRERFWYAAIGQALVDSETATEAGNRFADVLRGIGYRVGPAPAIADEQLTLGSQPKPE
jgi:hypothetical protein